MRMTSFEFQISVVTLANKSPAVSFPAGASRPQLWCNANKMQRSVLSHSEDKFAINPNMSNRFPGLLKHYGMVSNNESHSGDWGCLTTAWLIKADAQEMRVCVCIFKVCMQRIRQYRIYDRARHRSQTHSNQFTHFTPLQLRFLSQLQEEKSLVSWSSEKHL